MREDVPAVCDDCEPARQVRVGLVLEGRSLPGWQQVFVDRLHCDASVALAMVIERPRKNAGWPLRTFWTLVNAAEARLARLACTLLLSGASSLTERAASLEGIAWSSDALLVTDAGRRSILAADLDIIIDLTAQDRAQDLLGLARYGTWALQSDRGSYDGITPLGFWEFYRCDAICTIRVVCADTGSTVASGSYRTFPWSWNVNALFLAANASLLLVDSLKCASEEPAAPREIPASKRSASGESVAPHHACPNVMQAVLAPVICGFRVAAEAVRRGTFEDRWHIVLTEATVRPAGPVVLDPPLSSFWADPFVIRRDGKCCIFFEEYVYAERRGVISCVELASDRRRSPVEPLTAHRVLDCAHHLSYPFLFEHYDRLFMIPESSQNRTIELWECVEFPGKWKKRRNLLEDISAVDTTLLNWRGRWWMFTNVDRTGLGDHCSELHIYHCKDPLTGAWQPHARNPVVVDLRRARMAGGFLMTADGRPIRCCQVQGRKYGEGVAYSLIDQLSETEYNESLTGGVGETSGRRHHISQVDGLVVTDRCQETLKLKRFLGALWARRRDRRGSQRGGLVGAGEAAPQVQQAD